MAEHVGWRNFWWLNVAMNAFCFFAVLFGFPETKWHRDPILNKNGDNGKRNDLSQENPTVMAGQNIQAPSPHSATDLDEKNGFSGRIDSGRDEHLGHGGPNKQQWMPIQYTKNLVTSLVDDFYLPWKVLLYPIILFASFVASFSCTNYLMITFIQSEALTPKPYGFSTQQVGFTSFASLAGAFIGLLTAGPASDLISATLTKRNKGVREPEMRLLTLIPYVLVMILGNFIVSYGLKNHWNWKVSPGRGSSDI